MVDTVEDPISRRIDRAIFIVERIKQCYEAATQLFGDKYYEKTQPIRDAMQDLKNKTGCSTVAASQAVMDMLKRHNDLDAMGIMLTSAVIFDMSRESEVKDENQI